VRDWQQDVLEMVRTEGADKRGTARFLAYGVNGLSVALMVVVFSHTAGLTGAEVGIAGGSAVLGQKLLEAVFGDQAVAAWPSGPRRALERARRRLLEAERRRYRPARPLAPSTRRRPSSCAPAPDASTTPVRQSSGGTAPVKHSRRHHCLTRTRIAPSRRGRP
jgi:hypothetical protein